MTLRDASAYIAALPKAKELEPLLVVIGLVVLVGFILGYGVRAYISKRRRRRAR